jgi:regulatory protein
VPPRPAEGDEPFGEHRADPEAVEKALRFIEYRPRSAGETRARLRKWGYDPVDCDRVIAYLEELGLLDDREFARVFTGELVRKGLGVYRVRSELLKKKLDRELIEQVLTDEYPYEEEGERAREAAERRFTRLSSEDAATSRRKIIDHLIRKGFSRAVADSAFRALGDEVDTQTEPELEC